MYTAAVIGLGFIGAGDQVSGGALGQKVTDQDGTHAQALAAERRDVPGALPGGRASEAPKRA